MSAAPKDSHDSGRGGGQVVGSEPSYAQSQLDKSTSPWYVPNIDRLLIPEVSFSGFNLGTGGSSACPSDIYLEKRGGEKETKW